MFTIQKTLCFPSEAKIYKVVFIKEAITSRLQPYSLQAEILCRLQYHVRAATLYRVDVRFSSVFDKPQDKAPPDNIP